MSDAAPSELANTPWKTAFTSALQRLQDPAYVSTGAQALGHALDELEHNTFIQRQIEEVARAGDEAACALLAAGQVQLGRGQQVALDDAWRLAHVEDRHQRWLIQQWRFVRDCVAAWRLKRSPASLNTVLPVLERWADVNLRVEALESPQSLAWHDHTTALRALNLIWLGCALREAELPEASYSSLLFQLVELHAAVLVAKDFYTVGTNHGFDQAYSLLCLAAALPITPTQREAEIVARERLSFELGAAFNPEGVHVENSPSYHVTMMMRLLKAEKLLAAFDHPTPTHSVTATVERALHFLTHALKPDGSLPLLGDSDAKPLRLEQESLASFSAFAELQYAYSNGKEGREPRSCDGFFPQAGYAFMRDRWPSRGAPDGLHLTLKCGFLSQFHRHDDDNTLLLFAYGEDWLVGSGIYKYHEQDDLRRYLRSASAHNLLAVEHANVSRELEGPRCGIRAHTSTPTGAHIEAQSNMFDGFVYQRKLDYDRSDSSIALLDIMQPAIDGAYDLTLHFHVPADKTVEVFANDRVLVRSRRTSRALLIQLQSGPAKRVEVCSGQLAPPLGWTSPQVGVVEPAQSICFRLSAAGRIEVASRLSFEQVVSQ